MLHHLLLLELSDESLQLCCVHFFEFADNLGLGLCLRFRLCHFGLLFDYWLRRYWLNHGLAPRTLRQGRVESISHVLFWHLDEGGAPSDDLRLGWCYLRFLDFEGRLFYYRYNLLFWLFKDFDRFGNNDFGVMYRLLVRD